MDDAPAETPTAHPEGDMAQVIGQLPGFYHNGCADDVCWDLHDAVASFGRLVLIGGRWRWPSSATALHLRANDDNWELVFNEAARFARVIFVIPETSAGLISELNLILRNQWLAKTLILIPGDPEFKRYGTRMREPKKSAARAWEEIRVQLQSQGFCLPEFEPEGAMFRPKADLSPKTMIRYEICKRFLLPEDRKSIHIPQRQSMKIALRAFLPHFLSKFSLAEAADGLQGLPRLAECDKSAKDG